MALDYRKCAEEIFSHLGGRENVISAAHCATRLRLVIADNSKVDVAALEDTEGVKGVFNSNGQLQLIIGTGTVNKVYEEFLAITGMTAATKEEVKAAAAAKQPLPQRMVKTLGDVFVPILPAIVAAGLMMGLVQALGKVIPSFAGSDWYGFLDMVSSTAFSYLPVLVAISTARVFGGNLFLGGVVGLAMINSSLINAWSVAGMESVPTWQLLFFQVPQVGYQGHVIPVIIAVWLMCWIEKRLHKIVPEIIDLFVTPPGDGAGYHLHYLYHHRTHLLHCRDLHPVLCPVAGDGGLWRGRPGDGCHLPPDGGLRPASYVQCD